MGDSLFESTALLGQTVTKNLSDKSADKRKLAGTDIEGLVKDSLKPIVLDGRLLKCLTTEYAQSAYPHFRQGGLVGFAACAIALEHRAIQDVLPLLVPPILIMFSDVDPFVRYHACECMYNIAKVAREGMLSYFPDIFDGLCKLYADVDQSVKNGAKCLDRLIQDIATGSRLNFKVNDFIPLLQHRIRVLNPYIRQMVLGWIVLLDSVPDVDMLVYLSQYLEGLFAMLGDTYREIRTGADECLLEFLKEIKASAPAKARLIIADTAATVVRCCCLDANFSRLTALNWLVEFVHLQAELDAVGDDPSASSGLLALLPKLLGGALHCLDDSEEEISHLAVQAHYALVEAACNAGDKLPVVSIVEALLSSIRATKSTEVRKAFLQWVDTLLDHCSEEVLQPRTLDELLGPILEILQQPDNEVAVTSLHLAARIMVEPGAVREHSEASDPEDLFVTVCHRLLELFKKDSATLEARGTLAIRHFCDCLDARRLYVTMALSITKETDLSFARRLVQILNWILLTACETRALRAELRENALAVPKDSQAGSEDNLLDLLLVPWFHSPSSALGICLWTHRFHLAEALVVKMAKSGTGGEPSAQLERLAELLEAPTFSRVRHAMLAPRENLSLIRCILVLEMLLPRDEARSKLQERLRIAQTGLLLDRMLPPSAPQQDLAPMLQMFDNAVMNHLSRDTAREEIKLIRSGGENSGVPARRANGFVARNDAKETREGNRAKLEIGGSGRRTRVLSADSFKSN